MAGPSRRHVGQHPDSLEPLRPGAAPTSEDLDAIRAENDALQARLQTTILHSNLAWLPARGEDPKGSWQPEPGFCVFDMPPALLDEWLQLFRQNAAVRLDANKGCRLVWHPEIARMLTQPS